MVNERKHKRTSGLTGLELRLAYNALLKFKGTLVPTDESNADPPKATQGPEELVPVGFEDTLQPVTTENRPQCITKWCWGRTIWGIKISHLTMKPEISNTMH
jgi:hypothetical protein